MENTAHDALKNCGLIAGRMISYSKSTYRQKYPENIVAFNANIFTKKEKVWWGDLDITKDSESLQRAATECGETLYVLRELDGRFENEYREVNDLEKLAVAKFIPQTNLFDIL